MNGDVISRAALLEEIKLRRNQATIGKTEAARWEKIIKDFPASDAPEVATAPGWISVQERMPEYQQDVLVYYESGRMKISWRSFFSGGSLNFESIYGKATHWMPLPEPPTDSIPQEEDKDHGA